jgi:hypothetical protein
MSLSGTDPRILDAAPGRGTAVQVLRAVLLGCVVAAVFGSAPLLGWTEALPDGPVASVVHAIAERWNDAMTRVGATEPRERLRGTLRAFEARHFAE